jgi:hypothetical protein
MDPVEQWKVLSAAISLGGHIRVGMEDNPFLTPGEYARNNAELVEKAVFVSPMTSGVKSRRRMRRGRCFKWKKGSLFSPAPSRWSEPKAREFACRLVRRRKRSSRKSI